MLLRWISFLVIAFNMLVCIGANDILDIRITL